LRRALGRRRSELDELPPAPTLQRALTLHLEARVDAVFVWTETVVVEVP
jgi:hypothetical protein